MSTKIFRRLLGGGALVMALAATAATATWPTQALPPNASGFHVGSEMNVSGVPMRIRGFVSPSSRDDVAAWFRRSMGSPVVENQLGDKLVLGQARGEFYVTVQLEAQTGGTRGMVAISHMKGAADRSNATAEAAQRLLDRLPSGTRILEQVSSRDGPQMSHYVMLSNRNGEAVNRDRIVWMMQEDGMRLEREERVSGPLADDPKATLANGRSLWFKGRGKEAIVVLGRNPQGDSVVVFNKVTLMEQLK